MFHTIKVVLDYLLPPQCPGCGDATSKAHVFCASCWKQVTFLQKPWCEKCGVPLPYEVGDAVCVNCATFPPPYEKGRSVARYGGVIRDVILRLKHGDRTDLARSLGVWMVSAGQEFWREVDYLIPVPLYRWRLFKRGYNQATVLARTIHQFLHIPILTNVLIRSKATESQGHKSKSQRQKNMKSAFESHDPRKLLTDKTIVLIDDVWTTGATIEACVNALKKSGISKVYVLTVSRVLTEN